MTSVVALIPARANSKRFPGKNTRKLGDHPLLAYTIGAAQRAGIFDKILVCSDAKSVIQLAHEYKAETYLRPGSADTEPDIDWVQPVLDYLDPPFDAFAILRPTSPFRTAESIRWAWNLFTMAHTFDSLRAVRAVAEHPGKMWTLHESGHLLTLQPLLMQPAGLPWHSSPSQTLPPVYVQTAGLEIAWTKTVNQTGTIAGEKVLAHELRWPESLDINTEHDWWIAERAIHDGRATLPEI